MVGLPLLSILPHGLSFSLHFVCWWLTNTAALIPHATFTCLLSDLLHICLAVMYRMLMSQEKALFCDPEMLS